MVALTLLTMTQVVLDMKVMVLASDTTPMEARLAYKVAGAPGNIPAGTSRAERTAVNSQPARGCSAHSHRDSALLEQLAVPV